MMPYFNLLGRPIPMYGICALVGILLSGVLVWVILKKRKDYSKIHIINIPLAAAVGALIGAHAVYFLTRLDTLIEAFQNADTKFSSFVSTVSVLADVFGGMVFYGGLIGAIIAADIYCKVSRVDFSLYADIFAPAIPLFHAFGRIGCTFAGCCYGLEASWGVPVIHMHNDGTFHTATHIPVPLIEAACNIILMIILLILRSKNFKKGSLLAIYFIMYSVIRFTDEFFRGDLIRGRFLWFSTSQWISIIMLGVGIYMLLRRYTLKSKVQYGYHVPLGEIPEGYDYNKYAGAISPWEQEKLRRKQSALQAAQGHSTSDVLSQDNEPEKPDAKN